MLDQPNRDPVICDVDFVAAKLHEIAGHAPIVACTIVAVAIVGQPYIVAAAWFAEASREFAEFIGSDGSARLRACAEWFEAEHVRLGAMGGR